MLQKCKDNYNEKSSDEESLYITTFLKEPNNADPEKDLLTTSIKIKIK